MTRAAERVIHTNRKSLDPGETTAVSRPTITTRDELAEFCEQLRKADRIAFDTEFVSEDTYRPQLCLIQVAVADQLVAIDPLAAGDTNLFWQALAETGHETIVHAGREEISFCLEAVSAPPNDLFDVQLAAGLAGFEYPAGYGSLINKLLGKVLHKRETRTDWRRRPLTSQQIDYALDDVRDLTALRDILYERLDRLNRLPWLRDETNTWLDELRAYRQRDRWRRVTGSSNLSARDLAIVREIWRWREQEAERRNRPARRILRDDLIVELAKRRTADPRQIRAVRGMERGDLQRILPGLAEAIHVGMEVPVEQCPRTFRRESNPHLNMVAQFLSSALSSICRAAQVAPSIVGTAQDVRDFIDYRLGENNGEELPSLARGWRADVVGNLLDELLAGKTAIRICDPRSDKPLAFEPAEE
jgi:ribonuclease D